MCNNFKGHQPKAVEVFCTSVTTIEKAKFLLGKLQQEFPYCEINFDLEDCDNILRVVTLGRTLDVHSIIRLVRAYHEDIQVLPDAIPDKRAIW
ncbi:hypothetical protein [Flagellimonas oceanensis]|uniref:hypothetical protein n=1 Tax=Flagellimonas oceanensis TaxID=2499163 RepID=UPI000F8E8357|nr:hypothetical protein [Allomuricauda oceanensis]